jgi:hypothetical protein
MYTKITQVAYTLMTLSEAKAHLNIDVGFTVDDDLITGLISTTDELVQKHLNKMLSSGTVELESDKYSPVIQLPWGNAVSVESVFIDEVETTEFTFSTITQKVKITPCYSKVVINYTVTAPTIPLSAVHGGKMLLTSLYTHRGDEMDLPLVARQILSGSRYYGI